MPGPGEYRPDPSEGITRIEDLPKPKIRCQSRNYRRRPCPRCGQSAYRDRRVRRTLHDLGNPLTGRPRDLILIYSQHYCTRCRKYFNADVTDLAAPGSHSTKARCRHGRPLGHRGRLTVSHRQLEPLARSPRVRPLRHDPELGRGRGGKRRRDRARPSTSTGHSATSRAPSRPTSCMTARSASSRSSTTARTSGSPTTSFPTPRKPKTSRPFSASSTRRWRRAG